MIKLAQNIIIQAPMAGGATTPELVASVSNAGGLGSLGAGYLQPEEIRCVIKKIKELTDKPFSVNLFIPEKHSATPNQITYMQKIIKNISRDLPCTENNINPPYISNFDEQLDIIITEKIPLFSFTFGIPTEEQLRKLKENNISTMGTATTLEEAKLLEKNKIDYIVAQGLEAGGHRGNFLGGSEQNLEALITELIPQIKTPMIAAGGIMTSEDINKYLKRGAYGVQMGTVFLTTKESGISPKYKEILLHSKKETTVLTKAFSGKYARGINNKFIEKMDAYKKDILDYPIQNKLTQPMRKAAQETGNTDFMSLWAGQNAYLCEDISAGKLMEKLLREIKK